MSLDLIFWRGVTSESPGDVIKRFSRDEAVEGAELLDRAQVVDAFGEVFEGQIRIRTGSADVGDCLQGPMWEFSVREPLRCLWVRCAWRIVEHPELLKKLDVAGRSRLGCQLYDPQSSKFYPARPRDA